MNLAKLPPPPRPTTHGTIHASRGPLLLARIPHAALSDLVQIQVSEDRTVAAQVVAFENDYVQLAPFDHVEGVGPGAPISCLGHAPQLEVSNALEDKVVDPFGRATDQFAERSQPSQWRTTVPLFNRPPTTSERMPIDTIFSTGITAIDALCTIGVGQRIGVFGGAGLGKSTLFGMLSQSSSADLNVVALVGERGREVRDFIEMIRSLPKRSPVILVTATADESPLRRTLAAFAATSIAEAYRDRGANVLLMVDSLTRVGRAMREVGLAAGEFPVRQGYPPSVFTNLPKLLERAGRTSKGSITGVYSVLTTGEFEADPLADEAQSLLDGHITLTPEWRDLGIRPAIDPTRSLSRLMDRLQSADYLESSERIRGLCVRLLRDREVVLFGGEPDDELKVALALEPQLRQILNQRMEHSVALKESTTQVSHLCELIEPKVRMLN